MISSLVTDANRDAIFAELHRIFGVWRANQRARLTLFTVLVYTNTRIFPSVSWDVISHVTLRWWWWIKTTVIGISCGLTHLHNFFPLLRIDRMYQIRVLIGSLDCMCFLWSVWVISLVLVLRLLVESSGYLTWFKTNIHRIEWQFFLCYYI